MTENIVLIGMPGAGKSTIGVLLAKQLYMDFIDTDILIQNHAQRRLHEVIVEEGTEAFLLLEEKVITSIKATRTVIATGGSVPYSERSMKHLKKSGLVVLLDAPLMTLRNRLGNLVSRGVIFSSGHTLSELYEERQPLYQRYADVHIDCAQLDQQQIADAIAGNLAMRQKHDAS